jgi:hypothetical protein
MTNRNTPRADALSEASRVAVNEILRKREVEQYWANFAKLASAIAAQIGA